MMHFPSLPGWHGLHPLIVHFPVALLIVAPLFLVLSLVFGRYSRQFMLAAWILMVLGTTAAFLAVATGSAAGKLVERSPEIQEALEHHEELGETTRLIFAGLSGIFAALLFGPRLLRRDLRRPVLVTLSLVFLVLYGEGIVLLANTAHQGGQLVHGLGVRALVSTAAENPASAPESESRHQ